MSGPHGPNESTARRTPDGGSAEGSVGPGPTEQFPQHAYPADVHGAGAGAYRGPEQGQWQQGQSWGQPQPGAPGPAPGQPWGPTPQGWPQHNPGQPYPGQQWGAPGQQQWNPGGQGMAPGYPQQPQQFGQPGNQWAPPSGQPTHQQGGKKTGLWGGIAVAVVVVVGLIVALLSWTLGGKTLDQQAAQRGVEQIVTESYGARSVTGVNCPSGQEVEKGASFECTLTVDGSPKSVKVTFTDDEGTYEVSRPS